MADKGGDWEVVRRSRRQASSQDAFKQLLESKRLNIPVVPVGFNAIRIEDPEEIRQREALRDKRKAQKKRTKANKKLAQDRGDDNDSSDEDEDVPSSAPATSTKPAPSLQATVSAAAKPKTAAAPGWLYQLLCAWAAWISLILGLSKAPKRKRTPPKPKPAADTAVSDATAAATTATTTAATTSAAAQASKPVPTPAKAATTTTVPAQPTPAQSQQQAQPTAPAASPLPADTNTRSQSKGTGAQGNQGTNASHAPQAKATAAAAAAPVPTGPSSKCDRDWFRGRFLVSLLPDAHADVVSSVALAGSLGLSAGHDGALKLWSLRPGSCPKHVKNLVGHTGRVEAVAAHAGSSRAASSGRDSSLKVWTLGDGAATGAKELASYYVYESVRSMAAQWDGSGSGSSVAALGARSGNTSLFTLETGKKLAVLKGHGDEVTALAWASGAENGSGLLLSGSADGEVRGWDVRAPGAGGAEQLFAFQAARGKVTSLSLSQGNVYVGDSSTTVKVFDLRAVRDNRVTRGSATRMPNAAVFAGGPCPTVVHYSAPAGVLVSSGVAWWTEDMQVLAEAGDDAEVPAGLLNVHAMEPTGTAHDCMYSVRVGPGVVTCLAVQGDQQLVGTTTGSLAYLSLLRGSKNNHEPLDGNTRLQDPLPVGCEEHSEDEDEEDEDEDE